MNRRDMLIIRLKAHMRARDIIEGYQKVMNYGNNIGSNRQLDQGQGSVYATAGQQSQQPAETGAVRGVGR